MVFAVESKGDTPSLVHIHATEINNNAQAGKNTARGLVYMNLHASVEVNGAAAATSLAPQPTLLVRINTDDPDLQRSRVHLIRVTPIKERRVISDYSQNVFGGQRTKQYNDIPIVKADVDPDIWLKVTPVQPLPPGQYAIVFMPKDSIVNPEAIYDFQVSGDPEKP